MGAQPITPIGHLRVATGSQLTQASLVSLNISVLGAKQTEMQLKSIKAPTVNTKLTSN